MIVELDFTGVPEVDRIALVQSFKADIYHITSGNRDAWRNKQEIQKDLTSWCDNISQQLREYGFTFSKNDNNCYEYRGFGRFTICVPHTIERHSRFNFKSDFCVTLQEFYCSPNIGEYKTIEELMVKINELKK